jgi:hypothetical protein
MPYNIAMIRNGQFSIQRLFLDLSLGAVGLASVRVLFVNYTQNPSTGEGLVLTSAFYVSIISFGAIVGGLFHKRVLGSIYSLGLSLLIFPVASIVLLFVCLAFS